MTVVIIILLIKERTTFMDSHKKTFMQRERKCNGEHVSLIHHEDSVKFWAGEDMSTEKGMMVAIPCCYAGFIDLENQKVKHILETIYHDSDECVLKFDVDSAEQFAQLDHQHCVVCRQILSLDYMRPFMLRIVVAPSTETKEWEFFINHASACWDCWKCHTGELRMWLSDVDDNVLEYIENYAKKQVLQKTPPNRNATAKQLRKAAVLIVSAMNLYRFDDILLKNSTACPLLWDYTQLS